MYTRTLIYLDAVVCLVVISHNTYIVIVTIFKISKGFTILDCKLVIVCLSFFSLIMLHHQTFYMSDNTRHNS